MIIELPKGFNYREVAEWMDEHVGICQDEVTWFWESGEVYTQPCPHYPNLTITRVKQDRVKVFLDNPEVIVKAILRWL